MKMKIEIKKISKSKAKIASNKDISKSNDKFLSAMINEGNMKNEELDTEKLNALKDKMKKKKSLAEKPLAEEAKDKRSVSINFSVIGLGAAGGRIAESFNGYGYRVGAINTSKQDLDALGLGCDQKLLLNGSIGGTGKNRELSSEIFSDNKPEVMSFLEGVTSASDTVYVVASGGGGTGSGGISMVCSWAATIGIPVGVIYILPKRSEGAKNKDNALQSLSELGQLSADGFIDSLIIVDNSRIEVLLSHVGMTSFWLEANRLIVEPLHTFNHLTSTATSDALDPSDFGSILTAGGATIYGSIQVSDYTDETSLAEAVVESLSENMLSEGFDLKQTTTGGIIFVGSSKVLDKTPAICFDYAQHMTSEATNGAALFRGVYIDDTMGDYVQIYTMFSGLGLPESRVKELQEEVERLEKVAAEKSSKKVSNMRLDLDNKKSSSVHDDIHKKIRAKKSGFRKLQRGRALMDKRKK